MRNRSMLERNDLKAFCAFMEKNGWVQDLHTKADWQAARFQNTTTKVWLIIWDNNKATGCYTVTEDGLEWAVKFYDTRRKKR